MPAHFQGSPSAKIYLSIQSSAASRHKKGGPAEEQQAEHDEVTGNLIRGRHDPISATTNQEMYSGIMADYLNDLQKQIDLLRPTL
jgi:hypothetical protein